MALTDLAPMLAASAAMIFVGMFLMWVLSVRMHDVSIVDRVWGLGFALVAWLGLAIGDGSPQRRLLLAVIVGLWGLRLSWHIHSRNRNHGEDRRYQAFRRKAGPRYWWSSLFSAFWFQGLLMWFISLPIQVAATAPVPTGLTLLDALGVLVFAVGLTFEAVGDAQLRAFKADPDKEGEVMDRGLWRYTRHPNYFGDFLVWVGFYLTACATQWGPWTLLSPLLMGYFLRYVSGVPMLERDMAKRKPGYAAYMERTSAFVPLPPRKST